MVGTCGVGRRRQRAKGGEPPCRGARRGLVAEVAVLDAETRPCHPPNQSNGTPTEEAAPSDLFLRGSRPATETYGHKGACSRRSMAKPERVVWVLARSVRRGWHRTSRRTGAHLRAWKQA